MGFRWWGVGLDLMLRFGAGVVAAVAVVRAVAVAVRGGGCSECNCESGGIGEKAVVVAAVAVVRAAAAVRTVWWLQRLQLRTWYPWSHVDPVPLTECGRRVPCNWMLL